MKKVAIVYWSSSGNTEAMAKSVARGVEEGGGEAILKTPDAASADLVREADSLAFGSPAMGDEALEEDEMEPFIASLGSDILKDKPLGLFGSYDWGDGQWMRTWVERMKGQGAQVDGEGVIAQLVPGEAELAKCYELGKRLAG
jgi:flavodoxin short chain